MSKWGMVIDLDRCTGCEACVVACHAENNIRLSDEASAQKGRAMHWLRIERYYEGDFPDVRVNYMPVLCQHCEEAPCEPVCPTFATYHTAEGLNAMVYNRCVGTRFCANNCPYTARFFNWQSPEWPEPLERQLNPDVSPRPTGVMEKCSFCIQRIQDGQDRAADEQRDVIDGEIQPACAQSCPAAAITFGDRGDPESRVSRLGENPRAFHLLGELGTRPAVTYLKRGDSGGDDHGV